MISLKRMSNDEANQAYEILSSVLDDYLILISNKSDREINIYGSSEKLVVGSTLEIKSNISFNIVYNIGQILKGFIVKGVIAQQYLMDFPSNFTLEDKIEIILSAIELELAKSFEDFSFGKKKAYENAKKILNKDIEDMRF